MNTIKYESENGYTGVLCEKNGIWALAVFDGKLREVLHSSSPRCRTPEELKEVIEQVPSVIETLNEYGIQLLER